MRHLHRLLTLLIVGLATAQAASQTPLLRVVDAGPRGELAQRAEANQIRIVFSEPMVALGRIPAAPDVPWVSISPALAGTFRWSGTTVLLFTPAPDAPPPWATEYTVTVHGSATSVSGRALGSPYSFSFITPTPRLTSMRWFRRDDRFDRPVVLMLDFNQPVHAADVLAHARLEYVPHEFTAPSYSVLERARMNGIDSSALRTLDQKVVDARAAAGRSDQLAARVTTEWDRTRFPDTDTLVALETTTVPPPGTWINVRLDATLVGAGGPHPAGRVQSSVAELEPMFFARGFSCSQACDPGRYNGVQFTGAVEVTRFADALTVRDITVATDERLVDRTATVVPSAMDQSWAPEVADAGYERQPPATIFAYQLDASLQSADGQSLGYPFVGIVENWHERAFASFGDGHGVWEAGGGPLLPFSSRNLTSVTQWLTRLQPTDLMPRILALERNGFRDVPPGPGTTRPLNVVPDAIQAHGIDVGGVVPTGLGLVWAGLRPGDPIPRSSRAVANDRSDRSTLVQVTNLGLSVKDSPQSTLIFVTRLDTGEPVAGATVSLINTANEQVWRGATSLDGVAMAPALPLRSPDSWYTLAFIVTAEKDGDVAYLASNWNEGIMPWDFGQTFQLWEATDILRGSVFTDRGVYRPGEAVHAKAILRLDTPTGIRLLPAGTSVDVEITDSRGRQVDRRTLTLNRWSSAEWTWTVPSESTLGAFSIRALAPRPADASAGDETGRRTDAEWLKQVNGSFLVAAYRRPDFRVDATLTADTPVAGTRLTGHVDAAYLFGASLGSRPVRWSITRDLDLSIPAPIHERYPESRYAFGYRAESRTGAERVAGADTTLDESGTLAVAIDTARGIDAPWRYTFEGDVEDVSRQHIANRASVVVHPAPWYIGLRRPAYFADVSTGIETDVVAVGLDGAPTAGVPVTIELTRVQWNSVRRAEGGGFYTWDTEEIRTPAGQWHVTTNDTPVPLALPLPEGGSYVLTATATDADQRTTKTETSFYALGRGYTAWRRYDHNRITLEPERRTWRPGETARVMIQSPWETATALLTVEREGVRRYERFALTSTQQTVEVPILEEDVPNVFVSVLLIRGRTSDDPGTDGSDPGKPAFRLGYAELLVDDSSRRLDVALTADREEYRPANRARMSVAVRDQTGRPVAAEVTLWAVDQGVLSLTGYEAPDVRGAVYQRKALQVLTEDNRQRIVSRRVLTPKGGDEGGGGGQESGVGDTRQDFRPLAFWLGSIETDVDGTASREIELPEGLSTYRIMAVAADTVSRFGTGQTNIRITKPVTLLAAFPRFLSAGDQAAFGATVTNTLARGGRARVTIRSLDQDTLRVVGDDDVTVEVGPGASAAVRFPMIARQAGQARVRMTVRLNDETDAFETTLPVAAPAPTETVASSGRVDGTAVERIAMPQTPLPGMGGLRIDLSTSALAGLDEGAGYVVEYPYACAEQRASAALAFMLASDLGGAFTLAGIDADTYRARATALVADLGRYQCGDGGLALWPGACATGNAYLTAYVLQVWKTARDLNLATDARIVSSALDFLEADVRRTTMPEQVQWQTVWAATQAFAVKVLAEHGRNQDANITRLAAVVDRLPVFALSYLADAMAASGQRGSRYADIERRIMNAVRVEGDQAHVEDVPDDDLGWIWHSNTRTTAIVLDGLVGRGSTGPVTSQLARGLLDARRGGRWNNTQENATALRALVSYYRQAEADAPDVEATIRFGTREIGSAAFRERTSESQQVSLAMPELLRRVAVGAEADLTISREGSGPLYYTSRLTYGSALPLPATDEGILVERRYEPFVESGTVAPSTSFDAGDLIRVTLAITVPQERRYVAVSDPLPAGLEAVDGSFRTTAADLARDASVSVDDRANRWWFERSGFDHVERHDDRVTLFATRLAPGRHEFTYLVRATTAGTFRAAGTVAEQMYAPEVKGRTDFSIIEIR